MVGRLLWKELRESWLFVLIAVAAPVATDRLSSTIPFPMTRDLQDIICYSGVLGSSAVIMLWAIRKGSRRREEGTSPLAHVPANRLVEQTISILIPLVISALIGIWVGEHVPTHARFGGYTPVSHVAIAKQLREMHDMAVRFAALYVSAAFLGCYLISTAMSAWAGLLVGFVWGVVGLIWMVEISDIFNMHAAKEYWMAFLCRIALGAALCLLLFLVLRKKGQRISRFTSVALLAAVIFAPMLYKGFVAPDRSEPNIDTLRSSDRSMVMDLTYENAIESKDAESAVAAANDTGLADVPTVSITDMRTGRHLTHCFSGDVGLIGFDDNRSAYIVQQSPGSRRFRIIALAGHKMASVATIRASRDIVRTMVHGWIICHGFVSSDRQYLAFSLQSPLGDGVDVWIVNLRTGGGWVAFPNVSDTPDQVTWLGRRAVFAGYYYDLRTVDLVTRKTGTLKIPGQGG